jgi:predicted nucleotidyltransferase
MSTVAICDTRMGHRLIPVEIRAVVEEFIHQVSKIPSLLCVVLYGSAVRGELHENSDIDVFLLFETDHRPELGEEQREVARICVDAAIHTDSFFDFSFVVANTHQLADTDPSYLHNVFHEGVILWARPDFTLSLIPSPDRSARLIAE